jgi:hypothetical protein
MSTKKNAPPKKGGQSGTKGNTTATRNGKSSTSPAKNEFSAQKIDPELKALTTAIKNNGGVQAVIDILKAGQTREGPGIQKAQKVGSIGVVESSFESIGHSLELQADRIRSIRSRLTDLGFYDAGSKLSEKQEQIGSLSDKPSLTGKADYIAGVLVKHNEDLMTIMEHIDHLFSTSH